MHRNIKKLTKTKRFSEGPALKKRTFTENAQNLERSQPIAQFSKESVIDEDEQEEVFEKRAISFIENLSELKAIFYKSQSQNEGYQFQQINANIVKALQEKEEEYTQFYQLL